MAEPVEKVELPQATVGVPKRRRLSIVWIIPILAAVIAIGIAVQRARSEGPTITIVFKAADGIEAGKTFIKYKDVNIGQVRSVHLTDDLSKVEVTAKMTKRASGLMVEDAKFWIVRPTVSLSGISGLSTLLSGNYIGFQAGESKQEQTDFLGLDSAPFLAGKQGREFVLKAEDLGSLSVGSPIYYRRLPVGQVVSYGLAPDGKSVEVRVFVSTPYDRFVSAGTRFWKASGIDISVDANGFDVRTESLVALLVGGLAFDAPPFVPDVTPAAPETVFTLYGDRTTAMKAPEPVARHYVLYFNEGLRGLSIGAPVTLLGLAAGEVTDVGLELDVKTANIRPRVMITFYPERVIAHGNPAQREKFEQAMRGDDKARFAFIQRLIDERGLRAQLRSGSLITGQLYVAFDYFPKASKVKVDWKRDVPELPAVSSTLVDLEAKITGILDKIEKMPLDEIGSSIKKDLETLDTTLASATRLITRVDETLVPSLKSSFDALQRAIGGFEKTLEGVNRTLDNADATLLGPNAPAQQELRDALTEFTRAARSVRVLIDYLERHPESPIRGKVDMSGGK